MGTIIKQYGIMMVEIIGIILCIGILVGIATNVGESTALQATKMENAINADWAVVDTEGAEDVIDGEVIAAINDKLNDLDDSVVSLSTGLANTNTNLATKTNQLTSDITNLNTGLANTNTNLTTKTNQLTSNITNINNSLSTMNTSMSTISTNLGTTNNNLNNLSNRTVYDRGWWTGGAAYTKSIFAVLPGIYQTQPANCPSQFTLLNSASPGISLYGTLQVNSTGGYTSIIYISVYGQTCVWSQNQNKWITLN